MDKSKELAFLIKHYLNNIFVRIYFIAFFLLRITLAILSSGQVEMDAGAIFSAFAAGILSDLVASFFWLPIVLALQQFNIARILGHFIFNLILTSSIIAQLLFWLELKSAFNFVAIYYILNITHIPSLFENITFFYLSAAVVFALSALMSFFTLKYSIHRPSRKLILAMIVSALAIGAIYDSEKIGPKTNKYAHEISKNSHFELLRAYIDGNINYLKFYPTRSSYASLDLIKKRLLQKDSFFINKENLNRNIASNLPFSKKNIIIIMMDGIGAQNFSFSGNNGDIVPNLDKLQKESLFFTNFYATGLNQLRGIESLILSIPPLPGSSIINRKNSRNLYNIGSAFRDNGYVTDIFYGSYGFLHNIENFCILNHFMLTDKTNFISSEISNFSPLHISDEDVFSKALKKYDARYKRNKSFFSIINTNRHNIPAKFSSNISSKSAENLYAQYVDASVGTFLEEARSKPWFKDTIFVITSSHVSAAHKFNDLESKDFHIPLIIYAPNFVKPGTISNLASQIDIAPTILGLLNFSYRSKFFGQDLIKNAPKRALISNYQALGYLEAENLVILNPNNNPATFVIDGDTRTLMNPNTKLNNLAVSYYQTAYELFNFGEMEDGI